MPRYAKRHYEDVAEILAKGRLVRLPYPDNYYNDPNRGAVVRFIELFSRDNPRFNKDRFLEAIYK